MPEAFFQTRDYDLDATLDSGQVFRWRKTGTAWVGIVGSRVTRLETAKGGIRATCLRAPDDWGWLREFLQVDADLAPVLATFPADEPMRRAVETCRGLRLLRQNPWECLASFILSSTKQIVQIRQVVTALCERFGEPLPGFDGERWFTFPSARVLSQVSEAELRACRMGFRAPYLRETAQRVADGSIHLASLGRLPLEEARECLVQLPGVGRKIADCVLLFGYGFPRAFPLDVWILRGLKELYFARQRKVSPRRLRDFSETHFGPYSGHAQQYLFHYMRTRRKLDLNKDED
jgi:N-glycosylase/DNA lyase